ncbi:histone-lysine N-methyltransferase 2A isoform X2 [Denticeps clupeoides]|uniref:histone-lysine N-methyltransferase 2A isoform X2 n=1 Tax=Denticeps clupeoides TaxID=299321 RepID=UPI0010A4F85A|nr:histone-lysine N-methyltransferase 2B isoform X2 [Denticeps clupeoides]
MMAAAGCGAATAAAVGGAGGMGAARGRFPGRPWSSRSRLRSEKRWQLGRSGTEPDDAPNAGPRPSCLVLALSEDQSHLRLLGIEASHRSLGEVGYSSSGSEEGDEFRGFEADSEIHRNPTRPGLNPSKRRLSKKIHRRSAVGERQTSHQKSLPAPENKSTPEDKSLTCTSLDADTDAHENKTSKRKKKDGPPKQGGSSPKLTFKLVTKRTVKKGRVAVQKEANKSKALKVQPKGKKTQGEQISSAHVKLKASRAGGEKPLNSNVEEKKEVLTKQRGRSADIKAKLTVLDGTKVDLDDQISKVKLRKSARRSQVALTSAEAKTDEKKVKESEKASEESTPENTEVTKLARRSRRRAATLVPEGGGAPNEPGDQGAGEPKPQSKKKKRKKKSHKERDKNRVPAAAELEAADVFKSDEDMGIPGLKLTRIRNPKSSSRKKRNKFVWTLTLVKGKSKSTPEQEPQNPIKDTNGDVASQTQVDCPLPEESVPVKGRQPAEDMGTKAKDHGGETEKSFSVSEEKVSDHSGGVAEVAQARPEEGTQTEPEVLIGKEVVPPLQIKVVSSPGKLNSLKQSFLIQQVTPAPEEKEVLMKSLSEISDKADMLNSLAPVPQFKQRPILNPVRKKRTRHKLWSACKRKSKTTPDEPSVPSKKEPEPESVQPEPDPDPVLTAPAVPKSAKKRKSKGRVSRQKRTLPKIEEQQSDISSEPQNWELPTIEPVSTMDPRPVPESVNDSVFPVPEDQTEVKEEEAPSAESAELLWLEHKDTDRPQKHLGRPPKQKKNRRLLIGRRMKEQKVKASPEDLRDSSDSFSLMAASVPLRPKLVGVLKTKYKRKKLSSSTFHMKRLRLKPDDPSKAADVDLGHEGKDSGNDEPLSDFLEVERGKSKFVKNIKHFIMPVVSARSSRLIKTPKRFMDDAGMSVLPRRHSPKKGHQFGLHPKSSKKRDYGVPPLQTMPSPPFKQEDCPVETVDVELSPTQDADLKLMDSTDDLSFASLPEKRKSVLRDPSFKWRALGPAGEEVYTLDKDLECEYETLLAKELQTLIDSDPSIDLISVQKKKKTHKFNKRTHSKLYKKFHQVPIKNRKKLLAAEPANALTLPADDAEKAALDEGLMVSTLGEPLSEAEKAKLKIEDLDRPGVVRKVCVRALNSMPLFDELGEDFEINADALLPEKLLDDRLLSTEAIEVLHKEEDQKMEGQRSELFDRSSLHRPRPSGANRRMFSLLRKAKVQLIKIDQQKQLKSSGLLPGPGFALSREGIVAAKRRRWKQKYAGNVSPDKTESLQAQEVQRGGPRIKHVCRAAAVVLGQPRATVPDDVPRLSALPLHERTGISPSPTAPGVGLLSDPESPGFPEQKTSKYRRPGSRSSLANRNRRCGECKGCLHEEDCGKCINCLDKPKFGGPNTKRQCCVFKRCDEVEERKALRLSGKLNKGHSKRRRTFSIGYSSNEEGDGPDGIGRLSPSQAGDSPSLRKQPRRCVKPRSYCDLLDYDSDLDIMGGSNSTSPGRRRIPGPRNADDFPEDDWEEGLRQRRPGFNRGTPVRRKVEKVQQQQQAAGPLDTWDKADGGLTVEQLLLQMIENLPSSLELEPEIRLPMAVEPRADAFPVGQTGGGERQAVVEAAAHGDKSKTDVRLLLLSQSPPEQTPPSVLAALVNGFSQREREPSSKPSHKIRVDFKEDCNLQNVWQMGGMSILTSVPLMPEQVCLLCASKGQHQMLHCQVCSEPFHQFCLEPAERPTEENKENWCCRRCKFCHVCGRKNKQSKPLLECERCQNCYHPSCLGPNYPKPNKRKKTWVCMTCIRCRSCGVTPGKSWDTDWNHDKGLCPDCTKLYDQGNYCTICFKCYEDSDYDSQMMQCATCNHWVHAKCEGLTDDLYEILSSLPESVVYSCQPCNQHSHCKKPEEDDGAAWRELLQLELRAGVEKVLACLLSSTLSQHLVTCGECLPHDDPESDLEDLPPCDLRAVGKKFDKGLYTTLKSFHEDVVQVIRQQLEEEEESLPEDERPTALARSYYLKLMEEVFNWFNSQDPKVWEPRSKHLPHGMLSHAVMPPTNEHVYAQWREREGLGSPVDLSGNQVELKTEEEHRSTLQIHRFSSKFHPRNRASSLNMRGKLGRPCKADLDTMWTKDDERQCALCQKYGDAKSSEAGRLLYLGQNEWAHVNCSMWSAEVFEEDNGSLMHVHSAVARGRLMRCERCNRTGATVGCCLTSCQSNYHFMCARSRNCVFQDDKRVFCYKHRDLISGKMITGQGFEVLRRVYVDFEGISLRRKFLTGLEPESINLMIGSLEVSKLGKLSELSTCQGKLYPVGYECSRWFWSTVNPLYRSKYTCRVREVRPTVQEKPVEELPDQGDNRTIAHSPCPQSELLGLGLPLPNPPREASTTSLFAKPDPGARPKLAQTRRPAGGMSRPLPSPGAAPSKSHHILTISDLDDTHRPRRHSPHTQNTGTRKHMASPPLGTSSGPIALRAGGSMHTKSSQPSSPHFPLGATENLLTTSSVRSTARSASTTRCAGTIVPHSTSGLFPQPQWSGGISSPPSSLSPTIHHSPRPRLPFDLNQSDSEVPHNFRSLDVTVKNGTSPLRDSAGPQKGGHLVSEQKFSYTPFHMDTDLAVGSELKTELEIEETLLNEGVAMNCSAQIDVEGEDNQEDFWDRGLDGGKCKASEHTVPCAGSSKEDWGNTSSDEDMENYFDFSRTVVAHKAPRDPKAPTSPSLRPIPQLDGVDDGTESDGSMANADAQNFKNTCVQNPAQQLEVTTGRTSNGLNMDSVNLGCDALSVGRQTGHSARDSFQIRHENFHITKSDVLGLESVDSGTSSEFLRSQSMDSSCEDGIYSSKSVQKNHVSLQETDSVFSGNLKSLNAPLYQETNLDLPSDTPLILERCDSPSPSACFTDLVPVQDNVLPNEDLTKDSFLDPDSGYFVSSIDGSTVYPNHLSETMDISLSGAVNGSPVAEIDMLQPTAAGLPDSRLPQSETLASKPGGQTPFVAFKHSQSANISLCPAPNTQQKAALPPMESFRHRGNTSADLKQPVPLMSTGSVTCMSINVPSSTGNYGRASVTVYPTHSQPLVSTVSLVASSPSITTQTSNQCQPIHSILQQTPTSVVINGYTSTPAQKETVMGRTISINFSTPRPAMEPQQMVSQPLPGHAILTVKEVGGPNIDPTPHVLLVNRLGQIFVKNPESNTFQLPSPNTPSYNCVTQIASLLQSNALSATLATAGNLSATAAPGVPVPNTISRMVTPVVHSPTTITQLLSQNNSGGVTNTEAKKLQNNPNQSSECAMPGVKKSKKKKDSAPRKTKSTSGQDSKGKLCAGKGKSFVANREESAQAIINQAMAGYCDLNQSGQPVLSPSTIRNPTTVGKAQALSSVVLPPGLLIEPEPEPAATPPSAMSRPRSQVRMKRVSSFTDRVVPKKCKLDFMEYELPNEPEEPRRICLSSAKSGGVRIKTPTVKGILDLEKLNEDRNSDSENTRPGPWDRLTPSRGGEKMQAWDVGRHSMTDWNKYSGVISCSDDELPPSDSEEEAPPSREHPHLRFEITSDDGFSVEADSIEVAWRAVLDRVQEARAAWHLKQLAFVGMSGARMAGMLHDAIVYLVEQLEGAQRCQRHNFRFHKQATQEDDLPVNPSGCARTELYVRKSTFDMFNFLASQHRQLPDDGPYDEEEDEVPLKSTRRATSLELPMAMRFRHLEKTSKEAVGVYRSAIHGRGLFCKRNIDAGEMVIEYSGIVIRSVLTDKREKYYDGKGIGCYMFRIDDFDVVDATMHGNAARFINHSCEPNCYSRVINVEGQKHIVIFALRKIYRGEELTYDYKFPIEDESNKLGCNCGARRCRRFLN